MSDSTVCTVGLPAGREWSEGLASPEDRERVIGECLAAWLGRYRHDRDRRMYRNIWVGWCEWCTGEGVSWLDPPLGVGPLWVEWQLERYAPATVLKHMSVVSTALQTLRVWGLRRGGDPFAGHVIPPRRVQAHPEPRGLVYPFDEVVEAAAATGPRHHVTVLLLGGVGLRAGMAAQVHDERIELGPFGRVCTVIAKGGREFRFPVAPSLWLLSRVDGWPCDARSFVDRAGRRLSYPASDDRRVVHRLVREVGETMGVHLHPHQFRHWHVTKALELGVPLHVVQDSVGHADPKTTMGYARQRDVIVNHSSWSVLADITGDRGPV